MVTKSPVRRQDSQGKERRDGEVTGLEARAQDPVLLGVVGVATPGGDLGVARAVQVHRKRGLAVGSLFHFMQTLTHTFGSLKIIH